MNLEELEEVMDEFMENLPTSKTTIVEAEDLQSDFLKIQELVAKSILELEIELSEVAAINKMEFKRALMEGNTGKTAPEKKAVAEADEDYLETEKAKSIAKAQIVYLKTRLSIFNDAHLCCRAIAKGAQ